MLIRKIQQWLNINPAKDLPNLNDGYFRFGSLFQATKIEPNVWIKNTRVQNQYVTLRTYNACTCYGIAHCVNEYAYQEREKEYSKDDRKGDVLWELALKQGASLINGWYLQPCLEIVRGQGLISGYSLITSREEAMSALSRGNVLYTGAVGINWSTIGDGFWAKYFIETGRGGGHAFAIVGYDLSLQLWICKDSAGDKAHNDGYFYLPLGDFEKLSTTYSLHNIEDLDVFSKRKDEILLQFAQKNGFWNGTNPSKIITKEEWNLIMDRITSYLSARGIKIQRYERKNMGRSNTVLFLMKEAKKIFKDIKPW